MNKLVVQENKHIEENGEISSSSFLTTRRSTDTSILILEGYVRVTNADSNDELDFSNIYQRYSQEKLL